MKLEIGLIVKLFKKTKKGYTLLGNFSVVKVYSNQIILRKDTGYLETIAVFDLRNRQYRMINEKGQELRFEPLPDFMKIEREKINKDLAEYRNKSEHLENSNRVDKKGVSDDMGRLNIEVSELMEVCRKHGTGADGVKAVAEQFGLSHKQAENQIFHKKIKRLLAAEGHQMVKDAVEEEKKENPVAAHEKVHLVDEFKKRIAAGENLNEIIDSLVAEGNDKRIVCRYAAAFGYKSKWPKKNKSLKCDDTKESFQEINKTEPRIQKELPKRKLKPVMMAGETYLYELGSNLRVIFNNTTALEIVDLDGFIEELQEVKKIQEAI